MNQSIIKIKAGDSFWREGLLTRVGFVCGGISVATIFASMVLGRFTALLWAGLALGVAAVALHLMTKRGVSYSLRAWMIVGVSVLASMAFYLLAGLNPGPVLACAFCIVLTALLLGRNALLGVLGLFVVFLLAITASISTGVWRGPVPAVAGIPTPELWLRSTIVSALFWAGLGFSVLYVVTALEKSVERLRVKEQQRREAEQARQEAEARANQSQKLEALGQLAAGIAHDFNNALLVLRGWNDILKGNDSPEMHDQAYQAMDQAIDHSEQLAAQLLTFGRKQMRSPKYMSLDKLVERAMRTLGRVLPANVTLHVEAHSTGSIFADEGQVQQLLFNLVINAGDALPGGGDIHVRCANSSGSEIPGLPSTGPDDWVKLSVEDNGMGIDEEIRKRIFEPFFTTKNIGEGTGLGLATAFGIVQQSDAHISVDSELGEGARFTVLFPRFDVDPDKQQPQEKDVVATDHSGRILVLEDDPLARDLLVISLTNSGYDVVVASNGDEAMALIKQDAAAIDVLSADAVFPGVPLDEIIEAYIASNPKGQVLICSGYIPEETALKGVESGLYQYLPKPFTGDELIRKISTMLG